MKQRWIIPTKIVKVEEKKRAVKSYKTGKKLDDGKDEVAVEYENLGWFIFLEGMMESVGVGAEKPNVEVGQSARWVLEV